MEKVEKYYQYQLIPKHQTCPRDLYLAINMRTNSSLSPRVKQLDFAGEIHPQAPTVIEQALTTELPPLGARIATSQLGLMEIGAMAVLHNRALKFPISTRLVTAMATMDKFGPSIKGYKDQREACLVALTKMEEESTLETKVWWFSSLLAGWMGKLELTSLAATYSDFYQHLSSNVDIRLFNDGRACALETSDPLAITIGFQHASTVIVFNPNYPLDFDDPTAGTYQRVLINRFSPAVKVNFPKILATLNQADAMRANNQFSWYEDENLICSPEGRSSALTKDEVITIVKNNLV